MDASLIHLLPARRALGGWHLAFARAARSHAGMRALWRASGSTRSPERSVFGRRFSITSRTGPAVWRDGKISIDAELPETIRMSLVGKEASRFIEHDACAGRTIAAITVGTVSPVGLQTTVVLNEDQIGIDRLGGGIAARLLLPAYVVRDKAIDAITWLRLRRMARREEMIDCAWIDVGDPRIDPLAMTSAAILSIASTLAVIDLVLSRLPATACIMAIIGCAITSLVLVRLDDNGFRISDDAMIDPPWERERRLRLRSIPTPDPTSTV